MSVPPCNVREHDARVAFLCGLCSATAAVVQGGIEFLSPDFSGERLGEGVVDAARRVCEAAPASGDAGPHLTSPAGGSFA